jgi:hypothetical protein
MILLLLWLFAAAPLAGVTPLCARYRLAIAVAESKSVLKRELVRQMKRRESLGAKEAAGQE